MVTEVCMGIHLLATAKVKQELDAEKPAEFAPLLLVGRPKTLQNSPVGRSLNSSGSSCCTLSHVRKMESVYDSTQSELWHQSQAKLREQI
jgi:hypothetical protein